LFLDNRKIGTRKYFGPIDMEKHTGEEIGVPVSYSRRPGF
jgi:hypothetical protein